MNPHSSPSALPESKRTSSGPTFSLRREIPVWDGFDIVVAGGGPAGVAAALASARLGAKVLLVEAMGCFGGMSTSGLVCAFDPMGNGEENLVRGIMREIVMRVAEAGGISDPASQITRHNHWTRFRPEALKLVLDRMIAESGVTWRFFTKVIDADADPASGIVRGVVIQNVSGYKYVPARAFIDATGDAVLEDLAGAACRLAGRDTPKINPPTLASNWANVPAELRPLMAEYYRAHYKEFGDYFPYLDPQFVGMSNVGHGFGYLNGGHIFDIDATNDEHLARAMMTGREIAHGFLRLIHEHMTRFLPEVVHVELVATAALLGVRETRRIVGEYELNEEDVVTHREFPDAIGFYCKFSDIHVYEPTPEAYAAHKALRARTEPKIGERNSIPYGILVPKGWKNFWVAGRSASTDLVAGGAIRVQPYCSMMGQAAGTAAVQHLRTGQAASSLDTATLVDTLREQGAYLPQKSTSPVMTRAPKSA